MNLYSGGPVILWLRIKMDLGIRTRVVECQAWLEMLAHYDRNYSQYNLWY